MILLDGGTKGGVYFTSTEPTGRRYIRALPELGNRRARVK